MSLFEEIVNNSLLITEIAQFRERDIIDSINNMKRIRIGYSDGVGSKGKKERFIFPVAYGLTKAGNKAIRAFQTAGSTKRGVPKWKLFRLDRIYSLTKSRTSFKDYAQSLIDKGFNIDGDKGMTRIFAISPLAKDNVQVSKKTDIVNNGPSKKNDINPTTKLQTQSNDIKQQTALSNQQSNVDSLKQTNYISNNKINQNVNSEPIRKNDIVTQQNIEKNNDNIDTTQKSILNQNSNNQNQDDINVNKNDNVENIDTVKKQFNDMMNRINNINNNSEEEEDNNFKNGNI